MTYGGTTYAGTTYGGTTTSGRITALVNSIDTDTALTQGVRVRTGTSASTDTDIATTTPTRLRIGLVSAVDVDTATTVILRKGVVSAVDTDTSTTAGVRTRTGIATSTDADTAVVIPLRTRTPRVSSVDVDTSTTLGRQFRTANISSRDTDTAATELVLTAPTSNSNDGVQAVVDIAQNAQDALYTGDVPDAIAPLSQNRPKARKGEEKAIWVWSSASTDIDDFDAEYSRTTRTATVEAILQLNQSDREGDFADVATFAEDVVQLISRYARDNKTKTQFHSIKVVQREDRRAQNIPTNSLPYDVALTIELSRLVETA